MSYTHFRKLESMAMLFMLLIACIVTVRAQYAPTTKPQATTKQRTPTLTATLVDAEKKAQQKAATVSVKVDGIKLVDPGTVMEKPAAGQGHLHYQVDGGPIIATTTTKLSFHGLTPGAHKIVVMLAANDHTPLGPEQTLDVTIP
jgi:hypothetical protein